MPNRARPQPHQMRQALEEAQGHRCAIPSCSNTWTDMAHIQPSGMGGLKSTWRVDNLAGLCRQCHRIFDGQDLKGRQHMLRELLAHVVAGQREARLAFRVDAGDVT